MPKNVTAATTSNTNQSYQNVCHNMSLDRKPEVISKVKIMIFLLPPEYPDSQSSETNTRI